MTTPNKFILLTLAMAGASSLAIFCLHNQAQSQQRQSNPGQSTTESGGTMSPDGVQGGVASGNPGAAPGSEGGIMGEPGVSGDGSPGSSGMDGQPGSSAPGAAGDAGSGPDTPVSSGDTVSVNATGDNHEWTQEEMLLARPMPMSKEERDFVFSHKAPETIRTWSAEDFDLYVNDPIGAQQIFSEGQRWIDLRKMLIVQVRAGKNLLYGNK